LAKLLTKQGLRINRIFSNDGVDPLTDGIEYEIKSSKITEPDGTVVFEMDNIEAPKSWSQLAVDIAASKYFKRAQVPNTGREISVKQMVTRVSHTIRQFGEENDYFLSREDAQAFEDELTSLLITQKGAFNSPVWFNCGLFHKYGIKGNKPGTFFFNLKTNQVEECQDSYSHSQSSACFIQKIEDSLDSIYKLITNESKLFKFGSGTGTNFSALRGAGEPLSGGGKSSGLMSYLRILDRSAAAVKSGGITRRAAKMVILDMDHPEIEDFIWWKVKEEEKVKALIDAGYPSDFNGEAYQTVSGQNSNNSVMIPDSFMEAVLEDKEWSTIERVTGKIRKTYKARDLMKKISGAAWRCADPGVMFYDMMNKWHTCSNTEHIHATNPCSEYIFIDNTACNLASINLMKFIDEGGNFDIDGFKHACRIFFIAQEILVDFSSYPTRSITQRSHEFRTIGLGYANLGTLLMTEGIPYDSDKGRAIAGAITAIMTGQAYRTSAEIASIKEPFVRFEENREPMLKVMNLHRDAAYKIDVRHCPEYLLEAAREEWDNVIEEGDKYGFRNAQASVLAPTGTIGLLMGCDTTGVEPEFSLVKWKKLAGGGYFKIVNQSIERALRKLGYSDDQIEDIIRYILGAGTLRNAPYVNPLELRKLGYSDSDINDAEEYVKKFRTLDEYTPKINPKLLKEKGLTEEQIQKVKIYIEGAQTIEDAPHVQQKHYAVFDCANKCGVGKRFIAPMGHVKIMAAVQPFISGAISKTVNLPNEATVEDIQTIYFEAWRLGLKAIALYRDGCKLSQPLNTKLDENKTVSNGNIIERGMRKPLPQKRKGFALKTNIAGHKLFLHTGEYEDGKLGEIFLDIHKEGATYRSLMNCFAIAVSVGLQYGVPLKKFVDMFTFTKFEPHGMTDHPNIKTCTSMIDFVFRVLGMEYLGRTDFVHVKPKSIDELSLEEKDKKLDKFLESDKVNKDMAELMGDAPPCDLCGHITVRNGACYKCLNCGNSMGCS